MRTINTITIDAEPDRVFDTAVDILNWPRMLPHYRWVRKVGDHSGWGVFDMAARRSGIPVRWISIMRTSLIDRRIFFSHIGGLTRGMEVVWIVEPCAGACKVTIIHDLSIETPWVNTWIGKTIAGKVFIEHVADETLRHLKKWMEAT